MADFTALAATSETLRTLLRDRMELPATVTRSSVRITVSTPTQADDANVGAAEDARINLFLYRVTENADLRNQHIAGQASPGAYGIPPLGLDLHFLVTGYGATMEESFPSELRAQQMLGSAMRVLHDHPVITEDMVTRNDPVGRPILDPVLRDSTEQVKLLLSPVDLEDLSKVWTALTLRYRLSVGYVLSVVRIESQRRSLPPRLVGQPPAGGPRILVASFRRPRIEELLVSRDGGAGSPAPYARVGDRVTVGGSNLTDGPAVVWLDDISVEMEVSDREQLAFDVPDDPRLRVGAHPVRVEARVEGSTAPGISSNTAVLTVVPRVDGVTATVDAAARSLEVHGARLYDDRHEGETLVGDAVVAKERYTSADEDTIAMVLPDSLPDSHCTVLVSGELSPFPALTPAPEIRVVIGALPVTRVTLARRPTSLEEAATLLQAALRRASSAPSFAAARVTVLGQSLAIVPGGLRDQVTVENDASARDLRLTTARGAATRQAYLSGSLRPFPVLSAHAPSLSFHIAGAEHDASLPSVPQQLGAAAAALQSAIRSADSEPPFADARVSTLGDQLLLLGGSDPVRAAASAADPATAAELQLRAPYPVRVRVGGLENLEPASVVLP